MSEERREWMALVARLRQEIERLRAENADLLDCSVTKDKLKADLRNSTAEIERLRELIEEVAHAKRAKSDREGCAVYIEDGWFERAAKAAGGECG